MDLFTPLTIQATLESYNQQEQEMQRTLASLAQYGPRASYEAYKCACARMMKQINMRRQLFARMQQHAGE